MKRRIVVPKKIEVELLVANGHTCCICREPGGHVQLHHIDGDPSNNNKENLAVLCLNHHSRVSGDEGLGRRFSEDEVREYKRLWEGTLSESRVARHYHEAGIKKFLGELREFRKPRPSRLEKRQGRMRELEYLNKKLMPVAMRAAGFPDGNVHTADDRLLNELVSGLRKSDLLGTKRPANIKEAELKPFVLERNCLATKVIFFPGLLKKSIPSLKELAIWVSSPKGGGLGGNDPTDPWNFDGTFLYVVESFWEEDRELATVFSGCSALQALANAITGQPFFQRYSSEPLGRRSYLHPLEKLQKLGGFVMDQRNIEVLYKNRYMTDEQCYVDEEKAYRVHDLLVYPVFVCLLWEAE